MRTTPRRSPSLMISASECCLSQFAVPAVERSGNTSITSRRSSRASRLRACSHNTTERLAGAAACASIRSLKRLPMSFRSRAHVLAKLPIIQPTESTNCCLGAGKPINRRRLTRARDPRGVSGPLSVSDFPCGAGRKPISINSYWVSIWFNGGISSGSKSLVGCRR